MNKRKGQERRERNFGCVYKNKSGKWIGLADLGLDENLLWKF